jgi:hypothetical protein
MSEPEEIEKRAAKREVSTSDVKREYIVGWFLYGLSSFSGLKELLFRYSGVVVGLTARSSDILVDNLPLLTSRQFVPRGEDLCSPFSSSIGGFHFSM